MTTRLVVLMSCILLLSLAAFALLIEQSQRRVMTEVERTVAVVGRETLRSLEGEPGGGAPALWVGEEPGTGSPPGQVEVRERRLASGESLIVVRLDGVRAEGDAQSGLFLRIPTLHDAGAGEGAARRGVTATTVVEHGPPGERVARLAYEREIRLPVPTADYQAVFATTRRRTLLVFLSVFVLATLLSAGLARRFLRPVRTLDAAIHRLSEGDLDVQVAAGAGDEIGRLGRAFNDMAERLRAARDRAVELGRRERLQALGRLAAGVAHDVRNPLQAMSLTLRHLDETARPEAPARAAEFDRSLALLRDEIRRLDGLVTSFLRFARGGERRRVRVDLGELAREVARLVAREAERRGVAVTVESDASAAIDSDPEAVQAALLNLVLNSLEATPAGGSVAVSVRGEAGLVVLGVRDTGRGIPAGEREKVFDFGYTTREDGHGLGLAMVHQVVVEDHGGRVELDSREGEGTSVRLVFAAPQGGPA